jgi:hypothetical protein
VIVALFSFADIAYFYAPVLNFPITRGLFLSSALRFIIHLISKGLRPRNSAPKFTAQSVQNDSFKKISLSDFTAVG